MSERQTKQLAEQLTEKFNTAKIGLFASPKTCNEVLDTFTNEKERGIAAMAQGMTWNVAMEYAKQQVELALKGAK